MAGRGHARGGLQAQGGRGVSPTSHEIMDYIRANPGCTSKDIAEHFGSELVNVSSKTSRLYGQGYLAREPQDLRQAPRGMCYRLWVMV